MHGLSIIGGTADFTYHPDAGSQTRQAERQHLQPPVRYWEVPMHGPVRLLAISPVLHHGLLFRQVCEAQHHHQKAEQQLICKPGAQREFSGNSLRADQILQLHGEASSRMNSHM